MYYGSATNVMLLLLLLVLSRTNRYNVYILFICVYILFRLFSVYVLCWENEKKAVKINKKASMAKRLSLLLLRICHESRLHFYMIFFYFFLHIHHLNAQFLNICAVRFFSLKIVCFLDTFRVQWNFYSHGNVRLVQDIYRQHKRQRATSTVVIQCTHIILMGSHSAKQTWIYLPKNAFYARQTECARSSYIKSLIYSLFMDFGWALCGRYFHDIFTIFRFGNIFYLQYSHAYARSNFLKSDE